MLPGGRKEVGLVVLRDNGTGAVEDVGDSLAGSQWERGLMGAHPESDYERYLSIALETAIRL